MGCDLCTWQQVRYIDGTYSRELEFVPCEAHSPKPLPFVPNLNTWADLVDRLIVCVNKLSWFENKKREEQSKSAPDTALVAHWDNLSRNECEIRNILKREIDRVLGQVIESGEYKTLPDNRTFSAPRKTVADILAEQCEEIGKSTWDKLNG